MKGLDIKTKGVGEARTHLEAMGERARDLRRLSERIRSIYRESEEEMFAYQGRGQWPPLAESTIARKARGNRDPRMMRSTGALYRSLTATRASHQIDMRGHEGFRFGTTLWYARFHSFGEGVPQRTLIDITDRQKRQMSDLIRDYLARGGRGGGWF